MASPNELTPAIDASNHAEAHMLASMLKEQGIEAFVFDTAASNLLWDAPSVINPYVVHVQHKDVELARSVIHTKREDSIDLDWDEIDVGEMTDNGSLHLRDSLGMDWQQVLSMFLVWTLVLLIVVLITTVIL